MKRWSAVIAYRSEAGPTHRTVAIEELEELQEIVEQGPDWNTIISIAVTLERATTPNLTLEKARAS